MARWTSAAAAGAGGAKMAGFALWLIAQAATPGEVPAFDLAATRPPATVSLRLDRCDPAAEEGAVIVCANRDDRFRLPLRDPQNLRAELPAQALPGGMAALTGGGRCGIFAGERNCSRGEAAAYGYGEGRNPLDFLAKLAKRLATGEAN